MDTRRRKKKGMTKTKLLRGLRGSISILLCLILAPFLSVALGLVEYARLQQVIELTEEIYELTGMSVLADYDPYIHNRFGLLCVSQEDSFGTGFSAQLTENAKMMGNQISLNNISLTGKMSLQDADTLKKQLMDVSELTVTSAVLGKDFHLEELLEKLNEFSGFQNFTNVIDGLSTVADKLSEVVNQLNELKDIFEHLWHAIDNATNSANKLVEKTADFYKRLGDNGVMLNGSGETEETENRVLQAFVENYSLDLQSLSSAGKSLVDDFGNVKANLDEVKLAIVGLKSALQAAKDALVSINSSSADNTVDPNGKITQSAVEPMNAVITQIDTLVTDTLNSFKEETVSALKEVMRKIVEEAFQQCGLSQMVRYSDIIAGRYFTLPLSSQAKTDLLDLLETVKEIYDEQGSGDFTLLQAYFKERFIPDFHNINIDNLLNKVEQALQDAGENIVQNGEEKVQSILTKLVDIVRSLFDLDICYEPDFNAQVQTTSASTSPYQDFINNVNNLNTAASEFGESLVPLNVVQLFKSLAGIFKNIYKVIQSVFSIIGNILSNIGSLAGDMFTGNWKQLYERLLISGYMRHNLPCRIDDADLTAVPGGVRAQLAGEGLTGFPYDDIARPPAYPSAQSTAESSLSSMSGQLSNLQNGRGADRAFKGAEMEFILAGTNSEIANQTVAFLNIYFLRLLLDIPSVFQDGAVAATAAAASVASWLIYILYILIEPFCDTILLVNGGTVDLIRSQCYLTPVKIPDFLETLTDVIVSNAQLSAAVKNEIDGNLKVKMKEYIDENNYEPSSDVDSLMDGDGTQIDYRTTMLLLLFLAVDPADQIRRLQDIIRMETEQYYIDQGKTFRFGATYTALEIAANVTFYPFFDLGVASGGSPTLPAGRISQFVGY